MQGEKPRGKGLVVKRRGGPGCPLGSCWVSGRYGGGAVSGGKSRGQVWGDVILDAAELLPNEEMNPAGGLGREETRAWLPGRRAPMVWERQERGH